MDWQKLFLSFDGRISRQPFWIGTLILVGVNIVATLVFGEGMLGAVVAVALIYPSVCVSVKRWHDRGKSGWWVLIVLIPVIGWIWALVETRLPAGHLGGQRLRPGSTRDEHGDRLADASARHHEVGAGREARRVAREVERGADDLVRLRRRAAGRCSLARAARTRRMSHAFEMSVRKGPGMMQFTRTVGPKCVREADRHRVHAGLRSGVGNDRCRSAWSEPCSTRR